MHLNTRRLLLRLEFRYSVIRFNEYCWPNKVKLTEIFGGKKYKHVLDQNKGNMKSVDGKLVHKDYKITHFCEESQIFCAKEHDVLIINAEVRNKLLEVSSMENRLNNLKVRGSQYDIIWGSSSFTLSKLCSKQPLGALNRLA